MIPNSDYETSQTQENRLLQTNNQSTGIVTGTGTGSNHKKRASNELLSINTVNLNNPNELNDMLFPLTSSNSNFIENENIETEAEISLANPDLSLKIDNETLFHQNLDSQLSPLAFHISHTTTTLICANGEFDRCERENIASYYCDSCEPALVICHECNEKIHNNPACQYHHRIPILEMSMKDFENAYRKSLVSQIEKYADDLDVVKEVIDDTIEDLKEPLKNTIKIIQTNFIQVNDSMQKREKTLIKKTHELYNKKLALLRRQKALIEIVVKNADKAIGTKMYTNELKCL